MTKKHFIALADNIRAANETAKANDLEQYHFNPTQINVLASFCEQQNPNFNRERWLGYIAGTNGKNGGKV